jgi:coproporphyrinogen III oxidase
MIGGEVTPMQSPFPGIDPYLEASGRWRDFHHRFISEICDRLTKRLPPNYEAVVDEWIYLSDPYL